MNSIFHKIAIVIRDPAIRKRAFFTVGALIVFRLLSNIPIPGIDPEALGRLLSANQLLGFVDLISGGGISQLSIIMLGVGPYITASIIMQLLTMMFPKIKAMMQEEGEIGRRKLSQYSRLLSIPLAALQGYGFLTILQGQNIIPDLGTAALLTNVLIITAGSTLLMWIGELISEFGIGNGVSLIIFAGIVAVLPTRFSQFYTQFTAQGGAEQLPLLLVLVAIALLALVVVVVVTEAERPVAVTYAKQVRGNKVYGGTSTYLPLRLNQAGVIPIIFALSILVFPQVVAQFLAQSTNMVVANIGTWVGTIVGNQWTYGILYFVLVVLFTYFYTAVTFDPKQISDNLQKSGAFIPGVRPGESTMAHLGKIVTRITLVGALFLGVIAILPLIMQGMTGNQAFAVGGTALLIAVSVVLDLLKKIDAQASMREY